MESARANAAQRNTLEQRTRRGPRSARHSQTYAVGGGDQCSQIHDQHGLVKTGLPPVWSEPLVRHVSGHLVEHAAELHSTERCRYDEDHPMDLVIDPCHVIDTPTPPATNTTSTSDQLTRTGTLVVPRFVKPLVAEALGSRWQFIVPNHRLSSKSSPRLGHNLRTASGRQSGTDPQKRWWRLVLARIAVRVNLERRWMLVDEAGREGSEVLVVVAEVVSTSGVS